MKYIDIVRKLKIDFRDLDSLYSSCLGRMYTVQGRLEKITNNSKQTKVEFSKCKLYFDETTFDVQFLGFQNDQKVWIWGWDEKTELPEELFEFANTIKDFSEVYFIDYARRTNYVPKEDDFVRCMTATLCTLFDDYATFRIPADHGSIYVAIKVTDDILKKADFDTFISVCNHCLKNVKMNHRLFFEGFLMWCEVPYEFVGNAIIAKFEKEVRIEFIKQEDIYVTTKIEIKK